MYYLCNEIETIRSVGGAIETATTIMTFYILPDKQTEFESKFNLLTKHLAEKPSVEFGHVEKVVKHTVVDYGVDGFDHYKTSFDAVKVTIDDIKASEWVLVAEVLYDEGIVTMVSQKYFKDMPSQFGLGYDKCDFCGSVHHSRTKSYVLYNTLTNEYKQVGSTCVNKTINGGRYLGGLMVKLYDYVKAIGGCDEEGWRGGWCAPDHYLRQAVRFDHAVTVSRDFIAENGDHWQKAEYNDYGRKEKEGTNDGLVRFAEASKADTDNEFFMAVKLFFDGKEGGYNLNYYGEQEPTFTQKIKDAFEAEYIDLGQMFLAFFAVKEYLQSQTRPEWDALLEANNIVKGEKFDFKGELLNIESFEYEDPFSYYGGTKIGYIATFTSNGLTFTKELSYPEVCDPFKLDDGSYAFTAKVAWIDNRNRTVRFGGRLSKTKVRKVA